MINVWVLPIGCEKRAEREREGSGSLLHPPTLSGDWLVQSGWIVQGRENPWIFKLKQWQSVLLAARSYPLPWVIFISIHRSKRFCNKNKRFILDNFRLVPPCFSPFCVSLVPSEYDPGLLLPTDVGAGSSRCQSEWRFICAGPGTGRCY